MHVGVAELGGLGHMAVKFAKAFGVKVTVISTSPSKKKEAAEHLEANSFLVSCDIDQMEAAIGTIDGIIDTVSAIHHLLPLLNLLKSHGKLIIVGAPEKPLELPVFPLLMGRKTIAGSAAGDLKETKGMIDFAAKHNITSGIEVIPMDYVNTTLERLLKGDFESAHVSFFNTIIMNKGMPARTKRTASGSMNMLDDPLITILITENDLPVFVACKMFHYKWRQDILHQQ
ncbi:hypothetical protein TEA_018803 [Camellia sinensis var. sinensis]|uniref:Alcohol dehydrogenase-like C-terminal domain-containing protein n=1 Tax=Camellia sinensis var. sinensis TaxID=542762 RepID=A0A4S4D993_CAMSN|nr:hypothetical protein TEA_018803 [Camellia sinensis var. sinensis]